MKKIFKNRYFLVACAIFLLLVVAGGGYYFIRSAKKSDQKSGQENAITKTDKGDAANTEVTPESQKDYQSVGGETPTVNTSVGTLAEVSLTVYLSSEQTSSQDGKTVIPAGAISAYFYLPSGLYSVQKSASGTWKDVATNIQYPGHGGLFAGFTTATEDNIEYRVLKIEAGTVKSISKTFVVKRSELSGGVKTYN